MQYSSKRTTSSQITILQGLIDQTKKTYKAIFKSNTESFKQIFEHVSDKDEIFDLFKISVDHHLETSLQQFEETLIKEFESYFKTHIRHQMFLEQRYKSKIYKMKLKKIKSKSL